MEEENEKPKSCPKIIPANNNMTNLSYEEKLDIVEKEFQSLYEFCIEKKFTSTEMYNCVSNLYGPPKSLSKKMFNDSAKGFFILAVIIGIVSIVIMQPYLWVLLNVHAKLFAIKFVLPHWNWADLYEEDCMISNQWLPEKVDNFTADQCKYCEPFEVERLKYLKFDFLSKIIAENDGEPFVVSDTTKKWGDVKKLSVEEIVKIYQHHHLLSNTLGSCAFSNDVGLHDMFYDFFNAFADKKLPNEWHATWINCDPKAAKVLRAYHPRPYFLPPMMQMATENSVIVAKGISGDTKTILESGDSNRYDRAKAKWITVLSGSLKFTLQPNEECLKFKCKDNIIRLLPGETLFYMSEFWTSFYTTNSPETTVAVSNFVMWDDVN